MTTLILIGAVIVLALLQWQTDKKVRALTAEIKRLAKAQE